MGWKWVGEERGREEWKREQKWGEEGRGERRKREGKWEGEGQGREEKTEEGRRKKKMVMVAVGYDVV